MVDWTDFPGSENVESMLRRRNGDEAMFTLFIIFCVFVGGRVRLAQRTSDGCVASGTIWLCLGLDFDLHLCFGWISLSGLITGWLGWEHGALCSPGYVLWLSLVFVHLGLLRYSAFPASLYPGRFGWETLLWRWRLLEIATAASCVFGFYNFGLSGEMGRGCGGWVAM